MPEAARGQLHTRVHDDVVGHAMPSLEPPGITLRPILLTGLFIVVFTATTLGGLRFYYHLQGLGPLVQEPRMFPAPRLQQNPSSDLAAMLKEQHARLDGYAWIDRDRGLARIPVTEAMRILAGKGDAAYAAPVQPEQTPSLGSRGGASGSRPAPDGQPGAVRRPSSAERGAERR